MIFLMYKALGRMYILINIDTNIEIFFQEGYTTKSNAPFRERA